MGARAFYFVAPPLKPVGLTDARLLHTAFRSGLLAASSVRQLTLVIKPPVRRQRRRVLRNLRLTRLSCEWAKILEVCRTVRHLTIHIKDLDSRFETSNDFGLFSERFINAVRLAAVETFTFNAEGESLDPDAEGFDDENQRFAYVGAILPLLRSCRPDVSLRFKGFVRFPQGGYTTFPLFRVRRADLLFSYEPPDGVANSIFFLLKHSAEHLRSLVVRSFNSYWDGNEIEELLSGFPLLEEAGIPGADDSKPKLVLREHAPRLKTWVILRLGELEYVDVRSLNAIRFSFEQGQSPIVHDKTWLRKHMGDVKRIEFEHFVPEVVPPRDRMSSPFAAEAVGWSRWYLMLDQMGKVCKELGVDFVALGDAW